MIDYSSCRMEIGVIIRDEHGAVVVAWSKSCQGSVEPTMGEATTLFYAKSLCRELGIHEDIFEGDAKQVMDAINSNTSRWSRFVHLIEDTRQILQFLSRWECFFTKWAANEVAHRLAKRAISNVSDKIWRNQISDCINDVLIEQVVPSY